MTSEMYLSRRGVLTGLLAMSLLPRSACAGIVPERASATVINELGSKVLSRLVAAQRGRNALVAPHCLHSTLSALAAGGDMKLQEALAGTALTGKGRSVTALLGERASLKDEIGKPLGEGLQFKNAIGAWLSDEHAQLDEALVQKLQIALGATFFKADFKDMKVTNTINDWVSDATQKRIPKMIEKLDASTDFVLASAMFFKGDWKTAFDTARTGEQPFRLRSGTEKPVSMMTGIVNAGLWQNKRLRAVALPYGNDEQPQIYFCILQSKNRSKPFSTAQWDVARILRNVSFIPAKLAISLPKFKAEVESDMREPLMQVGLAALFGQHVRFPGFTSGPIAPPKISHAVAVDVDEVGTVAAAATTVTATRSMETVPIPLVVDAPFAFTISHSRLGLDLVQGMIEDPMG